MTNHRKLDFSLWLYLYDNMRAEAVQVAAVSVAFVEMLDRMNTIPLNTNGARTDGSGICRTF
jgi:hypothetical protein